MNNSRHYTYDWLLLVVLIYDVHQLRKTWELCGLLQIAAWDTVR